MHINRKDVYLVLDNVRSRENVGSIFRTADAVGVSKIYLCGITPTPETGNSKFETLNSKQTQNSNLKILNSDKIAKTALGAEKWVPWEYRKQAWRLLLELKNQKSKFKIVALEQTRDAQNIFTKGAIVKTRAVLVLVLGNEVKGLSPQILKYCDKKVFIPMYGKKESLNVSVATGIALYEIKRTT